MDSTALLKRASAVARRASSEPALSKSRAAGAFRSIRRQQQHLAGEGASAQVSGVWTIPAGGDAETTRPN